MKVTNPLDSIHNTIVFGAKDWSCSKRDAWIYGIVVGWEDCVTGKYDKVMMEEFQQKFNWSNEDVRDLKNLHAIYLKLSQTFQLSRAMLREQPNDKA